MLAVASVPSFNIHAEHMATASRLSLPDKFYNIFDNIINKNFHFFSSGKYGNSAPDARYKIQDAAA